MPQVRDIAAALAERTRPESAEAWDPVGLQLGDPEANVEVVGVCHEVTEDVVGALAHSQVDLLVTYHPLLFRPTNRVLAGRSAEARAFQLIRSGTALLVTHTDFDAAVDGSADALAESLNLRDVNPFGGDTEVGSPHVGRVGEFEATLEVLNDRVSQLFGADGLRTSGDRDSHLDRVAVVPGSGSEFIERAAGVADALVTGDVPHHRCVLAGDMGLAIVDPGHTATERPGMAALLRMVGAIPGVDVVDMTGFDPKTWF